LSSPEPESVVVHHFVDEAGTPTLFGRRRVSIVGQEGCSKFFILGKLDIDDPAALAEALGALRAEFLADPYFRTVPSFDPARGRTAAAFHAKDDPPEVRYRVFQVLMRHELHFSAVVRDKHCVVEEVRARNAADPEYWYTENELYDSLVSHLYKSGFHEADHLEILFARRGNKDRQEALRTALGSARQAYEARYGVKAHATVTFSTGSPKQSAGLQAVDYFLWALQRLYEKDESRYWDFVVGKAKLVHDMDDRREKQWGVFYNKSNPLTLEKRKK
jgi:hypothetical protein